MEAALRIKVVGTNRSKQQVRLVAEEKSIYIDSDCLVLRNSIAWRFGELHSMAEMAIFYLLPLGLKSLKA